MLRTFIIFFAVTSLLISGPVHAVESERVRGAQIYLNSGNPDQAIRTAQRHLKSADTLPSERVALLGLIAQAHIMSATHKHFENITSAVQAIETLNREFPDNPKAAEFRWKRAWLQWKSGDTKQAVTSAREIIAKDQQPHNLRRGWLLMARIHLQQENYAYARSDLLQYSLQAGSDGREQATGMAWLAIVDQGEERPEFAFRSMQTVYKKWPDILTEDPMLFSAYIHLLHQYNHTEETLKMVENFMDRYIDSPQAPPVRLIRADILATQKKSMRAAIQEYGILASSQAETIIGRKAFIRKLMLDFKYEQDRKKLLPAMMSLKKIADSNQLSVIEDEAMLALARFWTRIDKPSAEKLNSPALQAYARAAISTDTKIASAATSEGADWLKKNLQVMLDEKLWINAVTNWRQYPQLRPDKRKSHELRLGIAHAMRMLMLFDGAEILLKELHKENRGSIRGQRAMMDLAKLWMDRQDKDGVEKIMRWLNFNTYTIYRPEMLVTVARIQATQKQFEAARQTLSSVRANDIALESRANYWQTSAEISESLNRWHSAAKAWAKYRNSTTADKAEGLKNQARSLFKAKEFSAAKKLYATIPEEQRNPSWQYHIGVCELKSGETNQGMQRLQTLAALADGGTYSSLAKLALADQQANKLLGVKP